MSATDKPDSSRGPGSAQADPHGRPRLEHGEPMDQRAFHERYLNTPDGASAELIAGAVQLTLPLSGNRRGRSDARATGWLFTYSLATHGTEVLNGTPIILDEQNEPRPDSVLLIREEFGGQSRGGEGDDDYTLGAPELVVVLADRSRSIELDGKTRAYERAGVLEYVVIDPRENAVHWFVHREGRFRPLDRGPDGWFRSRAFPGLWLDPTTFFSADKAAFMAVLRLGLVSTEHARFIAELQRQREGIDDRR